MLQSWIRYKAYRRRSIAMWPRLSKGGFNRELERSRYRRAIDRAIFIAIGLAARGPRLRKVIYVRF